MQVRYTLFPWGNLEGTSTMALSFSKADLDPDLDVARMIVHAHHDGCASFWIEQAPWGEPRFDEVLFRCMAHRDLPRLDWVPTRDIRSEAWSSLRNVPWVIKASELLAAPTTIDHVREDILRLRFRPRPSEIIFCNPAPCNLSAALLDEVHDQLAPSLGCYVYLDNSVAGDEADVAMRHALPSCHTPWTVRRLTRHHNELSTGSWEP